MMNRFSTRVLAGIFAVAALSPAGCSSSTSPSGSGGSSTGGEVPSSGGASAGGSTTTMTSSGGAVTSGGASGSGGKAQAGSPAQGGMSSGGAVTGAGGQTALGGSETGGSMAGGSAVGGSTAGGSAAGGGKTGGSVAGGSKTDGGVGGGTATGGASSSGTGTGGTTTTGGTSGLPSGGAIVIPATGTYPVSAGKPTVYVAGDSTVSTYTAAQAPQQGWGQRIQEFFTSDVTIVNKAIGGESSKSFVDQGHLAEILAVIQPGDYLFAQWGINDRSVAGPDRATDPATTFRTYLKQYIDGARGKNAIPILVTPTPRLQYSDGVFQNGFAAYCDAIKAVGVETNTSVIDLQSMGLAYYTVLGYATVSTTISLNKTGQPDVLHFQAQGAYEMARLVAEGVQALKLPVSQFVIQAKLDGG